MDLTVVNHDDHDDHDECKSSAGGSTFWEPPMTGDHPSIGRFMGKLTMT